MKKILIPICLSVALLLTLSSCASNSETLPEISTSPMASASPSMLPEATNSMTPNAVATDEAPNFTDTPMASEQPTSAGVTSADDARKAAEDIEDELERLSEVTDAQVVIAGNDAAVALTFDSQYQGGIDDRLKEIVQERIDAVITGVTNLAVTDDVGIMDQLETLGEKLENATDLTDVQNELNAIINKITTAGTAKA